jgi:TetR/AcrR family transcriptional repressor of nem operon
LRYTRQHKEASRSRLLKQGGGHAKKHGFSGSGVDALAAAAGLTTGSLYKHFGGKSQLFAAIVRSELERSAVTFGDATTLDRAKLARALDRYLSMAHVEHPEQGCMLPVLTAEVARAGDAVRVEFEAGVNRIHAVLEQITGSRDRAWALLAQIVGAVMLARAMPDEQARRRVLEAARHSCHATLVQSGDGSVTGTPPPPEAQP